MTTAIVHEYAPRTVRFDERGIELGVWPGLSFLVGWSEVELVCPTPAMERGPDGWGEKPNHFLPEGFRSTLASSGLLVLEVVIRDRRSLLARADGFWARFRLASQLRPMLGADDRQLEDQSMLRLDVYKHVLGGSVTPLLDLLAEHTRFGLVVDF